MLVTEHCFECKESFEVDNQSGYYKDFENSGLCPACFDKAMRVLHEDPAVVAIEESCKRICASLDKIIDNINGINKAVSEILTDYKTKKEK
jgi:hypothetical protein